MLHLIMMACTFGQPIDAAELERECHNPRWPSSVNDRAFWHTMERRAMLPSPEPPERFRRLIDQLGWECEDARAWAREQLLAICRPDPSHARWLFRGLNDPDAQIRLGCQRTLQELSTCLFCRGTGKRPNRHIPSPISPGWQRLLGITDASCSVCYGKMRFWPTEWKP